MVRGRLRSFIFRGRSVSDFACVCPGVGGGGGVWVKSGDEKMGDGGGESKVNVWCGFLCVWEEEGRN